MNDPHLKPCPFCGGKAALSEAEECGPQAFVVSCNQCLACSQVRYALMEPVDHILAEAWNARVQTVREAINEEQVAAGAFGILNGSNRDEAYEAADGETSLVMEREAFATARIVLETYFTGTTFDLVYHLNRQIDFSRETFGPGERTKGVTDHIERELKEVRAAPHDLEEWIDLVTLSLDGAWRAGHSSVEICDALEAKLTKNMGRDWPDWRTADPDNAIEHDRSGEQ